jgi:UDP-N-acetylmuramate--alanine ligase
MPGAHNVLNALATIAVCDEQKVEAAVTRAALAEFTGVQRRFTVRGTAGGVMVVDDYGHHPTEVAATLGGARTSYPERRLIAVFQPHRYSRVRAHLEAFAACLDHADVVVLTDIYAAGEAPIEGVSIERLLAATAARRPGRAVLLDKSIAGLAERLADRTCVGDLVITLGAGSITRVSHDLAALLAARA